MSLFVSYTRTDEALVRALAGDLGRLGRRVWIDHQIHGGESWWREILREIRSAHVFVFALSEHSWRSRPCRLELIYAEQLGIPVLPVLVGPLESMFIPLAERQIIDYRDRSADAVVELVGALAELTARPVVLPDPLPEPPTVPFEYLYRIASVMGPDKISPDRQEELIGKLRRNLKNEEDEVARADIIKLLKELRDRRELTIQNAGEIDEILDGVEAKKVPLPEEGATRLPPADHWRRGAAESDQETTPEPGGVEAPEQPALSAEPPAPPPPEPSPAEELSRTQPIVPSAIATPNQASGAVPSWLEDIIRLGGSGTTAGQASPATAEPPPTAQWWAHQATARAEATPEWPQPIPHQPPPPPRRRRLAVLGVVLTAIGVLSVLLATAMPVFLGAALISSGLAVLIGAISVSRGEPRSRVMLAIAVIGLLIAIVYTATTV